MSLVLSEPLARHLRQLEAVPARDPLLARAQRNYPDSDYLQREWLRAVRLVRKTRCGWRLDNPLTREAAK